MVFDTLLSPVLNPLLALQPWAALLILSFLISLVIVVVYKFATNQDLMKRLKTEIKELQKEMKELRGHPEKAMAVNKKAMDTNMKYMSHSMRPTLITFIPIILIFAWMNAHLAYEPLLPGQQFTVTGEFADAFVGNASITVPSGLDVVGPVAREVVEGKAVWTLEGSAGDYVVDISAGDQLYSKDVEVALKRSYADVEESYDGNLRKVIIGNDPVKPWGELSLFGWKPGWLGTYIILSLVFSIVLRKVFRVY